MMSDLVRQFEKLWESSNSAPDVFEFLEQHDCSGADEILPVLLADQSWRWKTSQPLQVDDYLGRIPSLKNDPEIKLQLAAGETKASQNAHTRSNIDQSALLDSTPSIFDFEETLDSELVNSQMFDSEFELRPADTKLSALNSDCQQLGRYRLVRVLGEGAFGRVYLGFDEELERQVAIKIPKPERFKRTEDAESYLAEARTVAGLNHPNIVPVYDTGRTNDGSVYVVSQFIEGCTLAERFRQDRPSHEEAADLLATVAQALEHAHQKGLIHRDVKPGNILLDERTNTPYVADFGLAISEDRYLKDNRIAGTPAYMSPEQARGEGHRLDRRSDVFSVGMVLFELLTGYKPFKGSTTIQLLHQIIKDEPRQPRELDDSIPDELERICLKAMSKRASDRYATAAELADDLLHWNQGPQQEQHESQIVPKGLRSFDAGDAQSFLGLLPGPRNRNGLPDSIAFWKARIEETDPDKTFSVGLIYGPSGCGKSSLVKAGLLPHLSQNVTTIYVEATPEETESRILRGLRKQMPKLSQDLSLLQTLTLLRRGRGRKVVIVLDQFEQWLHAFRAEQGTELVAALRQCDGGRLQTVVMVRDDFAMAAARFMDALDIPIVQGDNFATVDLFDIEHARKVLIKFGQAFGKLPAQLGELTNKEQEFVTTVATGLAQDGKVISVRLALFAEMVKGKPWTPATLDDVGGTEGIGVNFLEDTFASRSANPQHRLHQEAAREVLIALLPEVGSDIKGHMRSHAELLETSGYQNQPEKFNELLRILDGELRLITPTDPAGFQPESGTEPDSKFYQLTHDYLVSSLRDWLTRKQIETRKGRADLKLSERSALWNAKPENRHLPSLLEWASIRTLTDKKKWNEPQRRLMKQASRFWGIRTGIFAAGLLALVFAGFAIRSSVDKGRQELVDQKREEQSDAEATRIVQGLLHADTSQINTIIEESLPEYRPWAEDDLSAAIAKLPDDANGKLHAALAILPSDESVLPFLGERLLTVAPDQFQHVRTLLYRKKTKLIPNYWKIAKDPRQEAGYRFQAVCALASFDPANKHWQNAEFQEFIAGHLVSVLPSELVRWRNALHPVKNQLTAPLAAIYRSDEEGEMALSFATDTLADYLSDDAEGLFKLLTDASQKQFGTMFNKLAVHRERAVELGNAEIAKVLPIDAGEKEKEARAIQQANAAVMLLRMNAPEQAWQLLKQSPDPLVRSYIVNWLIPRGGDPKPIITRYQQETDITIKRALLLSLGKIDESSLPKIELDSFLDALLTEYRNHPDAGFHGAVEWLLRKNGRGKQIAKIDLDLRRTEQELLAENDNRRQWFVNVRGQTFVILDAEEEFSMGSPESEIGRAPDEDLHQRYIGRQFAISTKEVTVEQWREFYESEKVFSPDQEQLKKFILTEDSPMLAVTWFDAAHYCNWLSKQEGIPEDQWCYEKNNDDEYGPGMTAAEDFLERSGYRLPTEAEWEFACRAGAESSRYFGATEALLSEYAWHQKNGNHHSHAVASLKPNDFGLFDMYGNAWEWCYDLYQGYLSDFEVTAEDVPETKAVSATGRRILRGGSFRNLPPTARSAARVADRPSARVLNHSFRPVRTWE